MANVHVREKEEERKIKIFANDGTLVETRVVKVKVSKERAREWSKRFWQEELVRAREAFEGAEDNLERAKLRVSVLEEKVEEILKEIK